jgi:hypothetical protein
VAVLGQSGEVDVVPAVAAHGNAGLGEAPAEDVADGGSHGPGEVERVEGAAVRFGDGRGDRKPGANAAPATLPQQPDPGLDDLAEGLGGVGRDGRAAGRGGDDPAAEPDQGGAEAVGVDLGGKDDRTVVGDGEAVGGASLAAGRAGADVDGDEPKGLQLARDGPGGGACHTELAGEDGAGGCLSGVDECQRGAEGVPASLGPGTGVGHAPILTLCKR